MLRYFPVLGILASASALADPPPVDPKTIPLLVFADHCLRSGGNNLVLAESLKKLKADYPKLLVELPAADKQKLFGENRPVGWLFAPGEQDKPITLSATSDGLCGVSSYGSIEAIRKPFEDKLQQFATANGGQSRLTGDASLLSGDGKSGFSYTIDLPKSTAYVMLVQSKDMVGPADHAIDMMSIFEAKK